jgi:hypothetical protein
MKSQKPNKAGEEMLFETIFDVAFSGFRYRILRAHIKFFSQLNNNLNSFTVKSVRQSKFVHVINNRAHDEQRAPFATR